MFDDGAAGEASLAFGTCSGAKEGPACFLGTELAGPRDNEPCDVRTDCAGSEALEGVSPRADLLPLLPRLCGTLNGGSDDFVRGVAAEEFAVGSGGARLNGRNILLLASSRPGSSFTELLVSPLSACFP